MSRTWPNSKKNMSFLVEIFLKLKMRPRPGNAPSRSDHFKSRIMYNLPVNFDFKLLMEEHVDFIIILLLTAYRNLQDVSMRPTIVAIRCHILKIDSVRF